MAEIQVLREKLIRIERVLNQEVVGHPDYVQALLLALIAREHVVLISPPGTAKSYLAHRLSRLVSARFFKYLMTKYTEPGELFGPLDVNALRQGRYVRLTRGKLPDAEIVFLDEVFKANSAVLNSLLSIMQERIYYDGYTEIRVPLWTMIGASNEVPEEPELQALYDRFSVRVFADYLQDEGLLLLALEARWAGNGGRVSEPLATMSDIEQLHSYAVGMLTKRIKQMGEPVYKVYHQNVIPIVMEMRRKGILVSDRTVVEKLPKLYAAYLTLRGLTLENLVLAGYEVLKYAATSRSQLRDISEAIKQAMGDVAELQEKLDMAVEALRAQDLARAEMYLQEIVSYDLTRIQGKPWLRPKVELIISHAKQKLEQLQQIKERIRQAAMEYEGA